MMDEGQDEASDLNPDDQQDESSDSEDDRFYFSRLKIMKNLKRHRLALHRDQMALNCQIKSLRQTLNSSSGLVDELQDAHQACTEKEDIIRTQENNILKLNQENQALKARCENINSEPQLEKEYRAFFDRNSQDMHEKSVIIEYLQSSTEAHLTSIQELKTKQINLEVQLEKAVMFGGLHVDQPMSKKEDLGRPHLYVEVSDVKEAEERRQDPSLDLQTKSWWRRQADKVVKGMGTFRLHFRCCLGVRTRKRRVVQAVNNNMDIGMPPVSLGMPPVSI